MLEMEAMALASLAIMSAATYFGVPYLARLSSDKPSKKDLRPGALKNTSSFSNLSTSPFVAAQRYVSSALAGVALPTSAHSLLGTNVVISSCTTEVGTATGVVRLSE